MGKDLLPGFLKHSINQTFVDWFLRVGWIKVESNRKSLLLSGPFPLCESKEGLKEPYTAYRITKNNC
jgi:hypothetical protein